MSSTSCYPLLGVVKSTAKTPDLYKFFPWLHVVTNPTDGRYSLSMSNVHSSRAYCALPVATKAISKTLLSTNSSYFLVVTTEPIVISPLFCASGTACYLPRPPFCYLATKPFSISPASAAKMIRLEDQPVVVSLVRGSNSSRRSICPTCRHIGVEVGAEREL